MHYCPAMIEILKKTLQPFVNIDLLHVIHHNTFVTTVQNGQINALHTKYRELPLATLWLAIQKNHVIIDC